MNWLAHLYLSEPNAAFRIGNLLPDFLRPAELAGLPSEFQRGAEQHRRIDLFTDTHPVFRTSASRITGDFRRFKGILVDMFYDHFLARDWAKFSATPLRDFATEIYTSFETHRSEIPAEAYFHLERMKRANWLCAYRETSGVSAALGRIGQRLRRPVPLANAISVLEKQYDSFYADFNAFFPEMISHLWTAKHRSASSCPASIDGAMLLTSAAAYSRIAGSP
jgi:acyl carrier protein phosphodiesterase